VSLVALHRTHSFLEWEVHVKAAVLSERNLNVQPLLCCLVDCFLQLIGLFLCLSVFEFFMFQYVPFKTKVAMHHHIL